jgi:hypothetical protein
VSASLTGRYTYSIQQPICYRKCQGALALQQAWESFVPCRCRVRIRVPSCRPRTICDDHGRHQAHSISRDHSPALERVQDSGNPCTTNMSSSFNAFPVLESSASLRGPQFQANRKSWEPLIQTFEAMSKAAMAEGEARHTDRHQSRGQLLGESFAATVVAEVAPADRDCALSERPHITTPRPRLTVPRTLSFCWIRTERRTALR